ncbi:hypothetical protein GCM10023081_07840 [Arthrobacter ginkgonis]|uniref:Uncharacterized protein n=1 Tax=Arthrobacter ginkgonis TaxID=1630594 RepID=A0ABP7BZR7_9MICC
MATERVGLPQALGGRKGPAQPAVGGAGVLLVHLLQRRTPIRRSAVRRPADARLRAAAGGLVLVFAKVFHPTMLGPHRKDPTARAQTPGANRWDAVALSCDPW